MGLMLPDHRENVEPHVHRGALFETSGPANGSYSCGSFSDPFDPSMAHGLMGGWIGATREAVVATICTLVDELHERHENEA